MTTWSAFTTLPAEAPAQALGEAMERLDPAPEGVGVFEIEDGSGRWEVGGYFTAPPDRAGLALLATLHGGRDFTVSEVPDEDWVDKVRRELTPVEAGRFFVYGSHDANKVPEGAIPLLIEAAMAFGTGHHGSTLGCLRAIDRLADGWSPARVADVGCGTAVLAMAAAKVWPAEVVASDIDSVAVEVARANLAANGLADRLLVFEAAGLDHPALAGPFDLVLANILKGPLIDLAPSIRRALAPGGRAVLAGLVVEQTEAVLAAYAAEGIGLETREDLGEWTTLTLVRE